MAPPSTVTEIRVQDDLTGRRALLIAAAERLFGEKGYQSTQVGDITRAAGTGVGTFYRHFDDKEDILTAILEPLFDTIRARFLSLREGIETRTPLEQFASIRENFRIILTELTTRPALARTLFRSGFGVNPAIDGLVWRFQTRIAGDLVEDFRRGEAAGLFRIPQPLVLAQSLVGMVLQVAHVMVIEAKPSLEDAIDALTRFTLGGLMAFAPDEQLVSIYRLLLQPPNEGGK